MNKFVRFGADGECDFRRKDFCYLKFLGGSACKPSRKMCLTEKRIMFSRALQIIKGNEQTNNTDFIHKCVSVLEIIFKRNKLFLLVIIGQWCLCIIDAISSHWMNPLMTLIKMMCNFSLFGLEREVFIIVKNSDGWR